MTRTPVRPAARWRSRLAAFVLLAAPAAPLRAQAARADMVAGVVRDSVVGIGIAGVEVRIDGTTMRVLSDEHGVFVLPKAMLGNGATLRLRRLGYVPRVLTVDSARGSAALDVPLAPAFQHLSAVQVRAERTKFAGRLAGYYERLERRTQGQFITRADIERERPAQLTDMLQRSPGIRITRGRPGAQSVRMRGRDCRPLVWIDGAPMTTFDVDLDSFSPGSLEGIEMYLGASNAPARYQAARGQSECGTILLWSRGTDTEPRTIGLGVSPSELDSLVASLSVFTSGEVDQAVSLDSAAWVVPYPPSLRASGIGGMVVAEFVVDTSGHVEAENFGIVAASHPFFGSAVREAAATASFRPAVRRGRKVRQLVRQPFEFRPAVERE